MATAYDAKPDRPFLQLAVRTGLWVALALGCVGGALAILRPAGGSETPTEDLGMDEGRMVPGPVAGVAEKTVERWLKATDAQRDDLAGMFVEPPSSAEDADIDELGGTGLDVRRVTTVAGERLAEGYWSVTVAVDLMVETSADADADTGTGTDTTFPSQTTTTDPVTGAPDVVGDPARRLVTWFFDLGVVAVDDNRYLALSAPSFASAPATGTAAWTVSGERAAPEPEDPLAALVEKFLAALLAGGGDPTPYLAPGADVPEAAGEPPFAALSVVELATEDLGDGQTWVLAHVVATTPEGAHLPLTYDLVVVERVDRWEVLKLSGVPTLIE